MRPTSLLFVALAMCQCQHAIADLFSSMFGLEQLVITEHGFEQIVTEYIQNEMERLETLKKSLIKSHTEPRQPGVWMGNPINAYRLVKKHVIDSGSTINLMRHNSAEEYLSILAKEFVLPSTEDLQGAVTAIFRLQDTYDLPAYTFANGEIPGAENKTMMDINDCFLLGNMAFGNRDYFHALPWLLLTEEKWNQARDSEEVVVVNFNRTMLYDYLTYSCYAQGNVEWATYYSRMLVAVEPTYVTASYLPLYEQLLAEHNSTWDGRQDTLPPLKNPRTNPPMFPNYEGLCRGKDFMSSEDRSKLYCYYKMDRPFLRLAPIKVEKMFTDPEVLLFKDVLSPREMRIIKEISGPNVGHPVHGLPLRRALVVNTNKANQDEADNIPAHFRVAKNFWMPEENYPDLMEPIVKRVDYMTNLDQKHTESLQIQNYGMGGHYEPHFDMAMEHENIDINNPTMGNRVATLLFYLSEPEAGGATAFEELKIAAFPTEGDALFWFNVKANGKPDLRTRHAACPVLYGQKWVANKWLHERGQEFRRPCTLNPDI